MSEIPAAAPPPPPYRSAAQQARMVMLALLVLVVVEIAAVVADIGRAGITGRLLRAENVSDSEITSSDSFVHLTAVIEIAVMLACAGLFLTWLYRVVANGPALGGRELRYTPAWAVGWWFVPVANLVRPFQVVAEAWMLSARDPEGSLGLLLPAWWGLFILGNVVSRVLVVRSGAADDLTALHSGAIIDAVASVVLIAAALLCVVMVRRLTERQELRHRALSAPPAAAGGAA